MGRIELHRLGLKKDNRLEQIELMIGLGRSLSHSKKDFVSNANGSQADRPSIEGSGLGVFILSRMDYERE